MRMSAVAAAILSVVALTAATTGSATVPARSSAGAQAGKIFLIVGENTSASQITRAHAPYLVGTLKPSAAWVTSYHSFTKSSSLGNYIAFTSGQFTKCEANNDVPDHCHQTVNNVFQQLQRAGRSWDEFNESAANPCDIVDHGAAWSKNIYSAHHDPALYYVGIHGKGYDEAIRPKAACREHDLAMGTTGPNDTSTFDAALQSGQLGDLNLIVPNDCENGHDPCGTKDPVRQFDDFLAREIPKIEASPAYGSTGQILVTWDEGADKPLNPGNPLFLAIGAGVRPRVVKAGHYDHYSLLRYVEQHFGLGLLAHARRAPSLPLGG